MSPDTITNLLHGVTALLAGGVLAFEHGLFDHETPTKDPTPMYTLGAATCGIFISLAYVAMDALGTLTLTTALLTFWAVFVGGGLVVKGCYWWDGRKARAKANRLDAQAQEIARKTAAEIKKVQG